VEARWVEYREKMSHPENELMKTWERVGMSIHTASDILVAF